MKEKYPHPGITMHQLPVGGNYPGLVFAVGSALIFLLAVPALWYVTVAAFALGLFIAAGLQLVSGKKENVSLRNAGKHTPICLKHYPWL